ncbi:hypothetical protein BC834DRAFT_844444 [Gloeopeniophorella convolvens]|nr:hypothetical protein BC834DRAFT_844444 [Gloeopeniophorella convolvens]
MVYCYRCDRWFPHESALDQHIRDSSAHWMCWKCNKDFTSYVGLKEHYVQSPRHHYCQYCDEDLDSRGEYLRHMDARHGYCRKHDQVFANQKGLQEHYKQSAYHFYCDICDELFANNDDLWNHAVYAHEICPRPGCRTYAPSYDALKNHFRTNHHWCEPCNKFFNSPANLAAHRNSNAHQPHNIRCPGAGCERTFVSGAALVQHFESGTCASGMTRAQLDRLVVRADKQHVLTNPARLIGWNDGATTSTTWVATGRSWNGFAYECFLCHRDFNQLAGLNQHLQSAVHQARIYRCPKTECSSEFGTLSGLAQHVERGSCGVRMFRAVQDAMDSLTRGFRSLTF